MALFYALKLENQVYWAFIITFLISFLRDFAHSLVTYRGYSPLSLQWIFIHSAKDAVSELLVSLTGRTKSEEKEERIKRDFEKETIRREK